MTLVIGISDGRHCWLGGDSAAVNGDQCAPAATKVWKTKTGWLVGASGDLRAIDLIKYAVRFPRLPEPSKVLETLAIEVHDTIRQAMTAHGYELEDEEDGKDHDDGYWLILGVHNRLFYLDDYGHPEAAPRVAAVGAGEDFAIGYMTDRAGHPESLIKTTMKRARERFPGVIRGPYTVLSNA
jgi:hypothetical protein